MNPPAGQEIASVCNSRRKISVSIVPRGVTFPHLTTNVDQDDGIVLALTNQENSTVSKSLFVIAAGTSVAMAFASIGLTLSARSRDRMTHSTIMHGTMAKSSQ